MKTNIELTCGMKLSISARFMGFDYPKWDDKKNMHPHYKVTFRVQKSHIDIHLKDCAHTFDYWGSVMDYRANKQELSESDLIDAALCFCADAEAYDANREFTDYCNSFGWVYLSDYEYAMSAFKVCKKGWNDYRRLFGNDWTVSEQLEEYMSNL